MVINCYNILKNFDFNIRNLILDHYAKKNKKKQTNKKKQKKKKHQKPLFLGLLLTSRVSLPFLIKYFPKYFVLLHTSSYEP